MNDARANESEFAQQELKNQLRDAHNSANELANRVEVLLAEKEALKRVMANFKSNLKDIFIQFLSCIYIYGCMTN